MLVLMQTVDNESPRSKRADQKQGSKMQQKAKRSEMHTSTATTFNDAILRRAHHWEQTRQDLISASTKEEKNIAADAHHKAKNQLSQAVTADWSKNKGCI